MERRKSVRKRIDCEAFLCGPSGEKISCRIMDYCRDGALIQLGAGQGRHAAALFDSHDHSVKLTFANTIQTVWHELPIRLVRASDDAFGLQFEAPNDKAYETLEGIASQPGARYQNSAFPKEHAALYRSLCDIVCKHIEPKFTQAIPGWLSDIREQAVAASSDALANEVMSMAERLDDQSESITNAVLESIGAVEGGSSDGMDAAAQVESLSLVDKLEFEDWLNVRVLTTKIETAHLSLLLQIKMRLESLGFEAIYADAIGPSGLVSAFHAALRPVKASAQVEKSLFRHFEIDVCARLQEPYKALNDYMIEQGVLPDLDYNKHVQPQAAPEAPSETGDLQAPSAPAAQAPSQPVAQQAQEASPHQRDHSAPFTGQSGHSGQQGALNDVYKGVVQLMSSLGRLASAEGQGDAGQGSAGYAEPTGPVWSYSDLLSPLNQLQANPVSYGASEPKRRLLDRVIERLDASDDTAKSISNEQREAIDVVDRFFASLKSNPRLSLDAKNQLLALEVPVLKALLNNEAFFAEEENAVQGVMNRIARLGAQGKKLHVGSRKRVNAVVQKITDDFDEDTEIFDDALDELDDIIEREDGLYKKNVERATAAADGVQRVQQAKMDVGRTLNEKIGQAPIPKVVATLVENGWRDLMQLTHIRHGADSDEWGELLELLDNLIAIGSGQETDADTQEIVATVYEKLKALSGDSDVAKALKDELNMLSAANDTPELVDPIVDQQAVEAANELDPRFVPEDLRHWVDVAQSLDLGTWMSSRKPDEDIQYIRLVWVAANGEKFVFVNHQGMKVVELGLTRLAIQLRDGSLCPDYDYETPIVNQGLDDMVRNVYDKLAAKSVENTQKPLETQDELATQIKALAESVEDEQSCVLAIVSIHSDSDHPQVKTSVERELVKFAQSSLKGSCAGYVSDSELVLFVIDDMSEGWCSELHKRLQCLLFELDHHELTLNVGEKVASTRGIQPLDLIQEARLVMEQEEAQQAGQSQIDQEKMKSVRTEEGDDSEPLLLSFDAAPINLDDIMVYAQTAEPLKEHLEHLRHAEAHVCSADSLVLIDPQTEKEARRIDDWWVHELTRPLYQDIFLKRYKTIRLRISGYAFNTQEWMERLEAVMHAERLNPSTIWFEIYHCAGIANIRYASEIIARLTAHGFKFCLDLASEEELPFDLVKNLPLAAIKIEQGWVDRPGLAEETSKPLIEIIHYLGKQVIACGVDSAISLQKMKKLGVDFVQGATVGEIDQIKPKYDQI